MTTLQKSSPFSRGIIKTVNPTYGCSHRSDLHVRDILFIVVFYFLSLRQKSEIFDTSLVRGRQGYSTKLRTMHRTEGGIDAHSCLFGKTIGFSLCVGRKISKAPSDEGAVSEAD